MSEAQAPALRFRVSQDEEQHLRLDSAHCLEAAAVIAREEGLEVHKSDFLRHLRRSLAAGLLRDVPYRDDFLGLDDDELNQQFGDHSRLVVHFAALSARFRQDADLRLVP